MLLISHIVVSVAWLSVVLPKLVLALVAATTIVQDTARALYVAMEVLSTVFPPLVIGTLLTDVVLTLGTRLGLLDYYCGSTIFVIAVAVFTTGGQFTSKLTQQSIYARAGLEVATASRSSHWFCERAACLSGCSPRT